VTDIKKPRAQLGKLPPQYTFILNPYAEYRLTRCPSCERKMAQRKLPLFIHVDPANPVALNYTCRYCPDCDLLIAHQDQIETLLARMFAYYDPTLIGNDYLVLGTVERAAWRAGTQQPKGIAEMLEYLHDFKEVHTIKVQPGGWYPAGMDPAERPFQEPAPLDTPWHKPPPGDRPAKFKEASRRRQKRRRR